MTQASRPPGAQSTSARWLRRLVGFLLVSTVPLTGPLYLIQGFMGLGLVVGIAAVGVIAFRSVVERRQQIGVLRAIGYQRGMVSLSFLIETTPRLVNPWAGMPGSRLNNARS